MSEKRYRGPKTPLPAPAWLKRRAAWLISRLAIDWDEFCSDSRSPTVVRQRSVFWTVLRDWRLPGMPASSYPLLARLSGQNHNTILCRVRDLEKAGGKELADAVRGELPKDIDTQPAEAIKVAALAPEQVAHVIYLPRPPVKKRLKAQPLTTHEQLREDVRLAKLKAKSSRGEAA